MSLTGEQLGYDPSELRELPGQNDDVWIGGAFEVGGGMGFYINKKGERRFLSYPYIQFQDNKFQLVTFVAKYFEKSPYSTLDSWVVRISGINVPSLAKKFHPYAPSRRAIIEAMANWETADFQRRVEIARQNIARDRSSVTPEDFRLLLQNPNFLAGIVDSRGIWSPDTRMNAVQPRLFIVSKNQVLLDTIAALFDGHVNHSKKGRDISYTLAVTSRTGIDKLLDQAKKYLRFPERVNV